MHHAYKAHIYKHDTHDYSSNHDNTMYITLVVLNEAMFRKNAPFYGHPIANMDSNILKMEASSLSSDF